MWATASASSKSGRPEAAGGCIDVERPQADQLVGELQSTQREYRQKPGSNLRMVQAIGQAGGREHVDDLGDDGLARRQLLLSPLDPLEELVAGLRPGLVIPGQVAEDDVRVEESHASLSFRRVRSALASRATRDCSSKSSGFPEGSHRPVGGFQTEGNGLKTHLPLGDREGHLVSRLQAEQAPHLGRDGDLTPLREGGGDFLHFLGSRYQMIDSMSQ